MKLELFNNWYRDRYTNFCARWGLLISALLEVGIKTEIGIANTMKLRIQDKVKNAQKTQFLLNPNSSLAQTEINNLQSIINRGNELITEIDKKNSDLNEDAKQQ